MRNLSSIFERVRLDEDFLRIMILRGQGTEITLENISTPPRIEKYAPDREVSPKSGEAELLALGWRLVPVPWLSVEGGAKAFVELPELLAGNAALRRARPTLRQPPRGALVCAGASGVASN